MLVLATIVIIIKSVYSKSEQFEIDDIIAGL